MARLRHARHLRAFFRRPELVIERDYPAFLRREVREAPAPSEGPCISVLLAAYDTAPAHLSAAIRSVLDQSYGNWELCIADDASTLPHVAEIVERFAAAEPRIRHTRLARNGGIAAATNAALGLAGGAFVALFDHDDILPPHALACVAAEIVAHPDVDLLFSDEDKLRGADRSGPYFKPGWNPDLFLAQNLVSHLGVYRRSLMLALGGLREGFPGSQDYDLALRAVANTQGGRIRHIPRVLYHWRQHEQSFSAQRAEACAASARRALGEHLGASVRVEANPVITGWTRIVYSLPEPPPRVSLVLLDGAKAPVLGGEEATRGEEEAIAPGSAPASSGFGGDVVVWRGDALQAPGDVLVFWPPGYALSGAETLRELVSQALRLGVGAAGPRIDDKAGRIVDSGLVLDPEAIGCTVAPQSDAGDPGYSGAFILARTVSAVSLAGLSVRAEVFRRLGGFDARAGAYADIDFCLRLGEEGLRIVWTPYARLCGQPARPGAAGRAYMRERWGAVLKRDPFLNENLRVSNGALRL